mgnify:CR=1 FL=1
MLIWFVTYAVGAVLYEIYIVHMFQQNSYKPREYRVLTNIVIAFITQAAIKHPVFPTSTNGSDITTYYVADAARILREMPNLTVIGVTGSYGKTSVKYFLNTLLSSRFNVLQTPGNYNTTLGVVRTHSLPHSCQSYVREYNRCRNSGIPCPLPAPHPPAQTWCR